MAALRSRYVESDDAHRRTGRAAHCRAWCVERPVEQHDLLPTDPHLDHRRSRDVLRELSDHALADGAMIGSRRAHVAALSLALSALAPIAVAQGPAVGARLGNAGTASPATLNAPTADSTRDVEIPLASVTASGFPRSFQVVSIPVPEVFSGVMNL